MGGVGEKEENSMKAIVRANYGPPDVLELKDLGKPEPGDDGVLVRVNATSVNPADWHILRGDPYVSRLQLGLRKPKTGFSAAMWRGGSKWSAITSGCSG